MRINNQEVELEDLLKENLHDNLLKDCGNGIYLTEEDQEILKRYNFNYKNYNNIKSLIFDIEQFLNDNYEEETDDLESIVTNLQELNYYQNTNK